MAVAPIAFVAASVVSLSVLNEAANGSMASDITGWWMFVMIFGGLLFAPGICSTLVGAARLGHRLGTILTLIGLALLSTAALLLGAAGFEDAFSAPAGEYEPRWTARLSVGGATIYAIPFALLVIGNAYAAWIIWSEHVVGEGLPVPAEDS
ncbi:hypothetical protein [Nocardia cyriacigeorgica]|uniref:hypothetical protein n=1 Tax=Nocardia cyriacigeorgica TaxID=135487 RepID=UPI002459094E|nr:hypothetical protein [Nocardia cyriacigeorgica]